MKTGWASRLRDRMARTGPTSQLADALDNYSSLVLPHQGDPLALSEKQTSQNLEVWIDAIPQRLESLRSLLSVSAESSAPVSWPDACPNGLESVELITALHTWTTETWAQIASNVPHEPKKPWRIGQRSGDFIAYTMIADISMLIGEVIRSGRPSWSWAIDRDPTNISDGMGSVNRVVLVSCWREDPANQVELDVEEVVATTFVESPHQGFYVEDRWTRLVNNAISGAYEGAHL